MKKINKQIRKWAKDTNRHKIQMAYKHENSSNALVNTAIHKKTRGTILQPWIGKRSDNTKNC